MSLQAIGTKIVVKRIVKEQTHASGLVLSNSSDPNPPAELVSIGPEAQEKNPQLAQGQLAHIAWNSVAQVKYQGEELYIVDVTGVFAIEV